MPNNKQNRSLPGRLSRLFYSTKYRTVATPPRDTRNLRTIGLGTLASKVAQPAASTSTNPNKIAIVLERFGPPGEKDEQIGAFENYQRANLISLLPETSFFRTAQELLDKDIPKETRQLWDAMRESGVVDFIGYHVWVLPENENDLFEEDGVGIPNIDKTSGAIRNSAEFPVMRIKNAFVLSNVDLVRGAIVRIDYENREQERGMYLVDVINNDSQFGRAIWAELSSFNEATRTFNQTTLADAPPLVQHATGDPIGNGNGAVALHNAYMSIYKQEGDEKVDIDELYQRLNAEFNDAKLALGIVANAQYESAFSTKIVSSPQSESSLGLWQMNVGPPSLRSVRYGAPRSAMTSFAQESLPPALIMPSTSRSVPYFAGGLLVRSLGFEVVTSTEYDGTQDVFQIYSTVANAENQINFVVSATKKMLADLDYETIKQEDTVTAGQWSLWFQLYFEQPAAVSQARLILGDQLADRFGVA